ncbi:polarity establishment/cellular polarization [Elasticomyces elasticus]|nr:polarity establishment/cellular polarization [Elasticomyces elasticus]
MPQVAFPFNSQVPTVARVGVPYHFQISPTTFVPDATKFTYSLSEAPAWLNIDRISGTLSGTPGVNNAGPTLFNLIASDKDGSVGMRSTLVVVTTPAPQFLGDITEALTQTGKLSGPSSISLSRSSSFTINFPSNAFSDSTGANLSYYATLADHTPLPAWLHFDASSLTFSGAAPALSASPQYFDINLIASDVVGFAGITASFTIFLTTHQLVFEPEEQEIQATIGTKVEYTSLRRQLVLDGVLVKSGDVQHASAETPQWLSLDVETLALVGTPPQGAVDQDVTISVTDHFGDIANATIHIRFGNHSFFSGQIGSMNATIGQSFTYTIPRSVFTQSDLDLSVTFAPEYSWLHFDAHTLTLSGDVPSSAQPSIEDATMTAVSPASSSTQTQEFQILIVSAATTLPASTTHASHASPATPTGTSTTASGGAEIGPPSQDGLSCGSIAAIVICAFAVPILLVALLFLCHKRRREQTRPTRSPSKLHISRPIAPDTLWQSAPVLEQNIEKEAPQDLLEPTRTPDRAPQIALSLPTNPTSISRGEYRQSQASSIGDGADLLLDDANLFGGTLKSHTPHDSMKVPTEIARLSRFTDLSPTKRARETARESGKSRQSAGLGIDFGDGQRVTKKLRSSHGRTLSNLRLSMLGGRDRSSYASRSTLSTGMLSAAPSDFPRPPSRYSKTLSRSIPMLALTDAEKRKSIRLVDRSDSVVDKRSISERRQSYIRNRASSKSPFFAAGSSRDSSHPKPGSLRSTADFTSSIGDSGHCINPRRQRRGKSELTSYSASSSLEPPLRNPYRLSSRIRSGFSAGFPRPMSQTLTRSSVPREDSQNLQKVESHSSLYTTTTSSGSDVDLPIVPPRHQRSWVLPGEASPTPPPLTPNKWKTSQQQQQQQVYEPYDADAAARAVLEEERERIAARKKWAQKLNRNSRGSLLSPPEVAIAVPKSSRSSLAASGRASQLRRSRVTSGASSASGSAGAGAMLGMRTPMGLISNDSLSSARRAERPRLVNSKGKRPVSVEDVKRLSSLRAEKEGGGVGNELGVWEDVTAGAEKGNDDDEDGRDLTPALI